MDDVKTILVTGGCGFIGSSVVNQLLTRYPNVEVINIDALTYAADPTRVNATDKYTLIERWIDDAHSTKEIIARTKPDLVIHLAAESHVDRSIENGLKFVDSNVRGTASILEALKGTKIPILYVSTDEVYGEAQDTRGFLETDRKQPRNPYSATKAAGEDLVEAFANTFGVRFAITRGSNTYGARQNSEKFIPATVRRLRTGSPAVLYGDGQQVREWLHVEDHASAIIRVAELLLSGLDDGGPFIYNIGSGVYGRNIDVFRQLAAASGAANPSYELVRDRPGHDRRYSIDSRRLRRLGWQPEHSPAGPQENGEFWPLEEAEVMAIVAAQSDIM